ncbi:Uncharacterised protein [Mycobacterium tuberculosis]|uniref:Uncharacterized protein n=1 Tax=Mycobacterium tuberculosis TaxID=1773 RepID=A0A916LG44_MYCTX|nr:Uncharacterised protein [Mycobacterium tuberculosis]
MTRPATAQSRLSCGNAGVAHTCSNPKRINRIGNAPIRAQS